MRLAAWGAALLAHRSQRQSGVQLEALCKDFLCTQPETTPTEERHPTPGDLGATYTARLIIRSGIRLNTTNQQDYRRISRSERG